MNFCPDRHKRLGSFDDVKNVRFYCSSSSDFITGQTIFGGNIKIKNGKLFLTKIK